MMTPVAVVVVVEKEWTVQAGRGSWKHPEEREMLSQQRIRPTRRRRRHCRLGQSASCRPSVARVASSEADWGGGQGAQAGPSPPCVGLLGGRPGK